MVSGLPPGAAAAAAAAAAVAVCWYFGGGLPLWGAATALPCYLFSYHRTVTYFVVFVVGLLAVGWIFFSQRLILKLVNSSAYSEDAAGSPNGMLLERLGPDNIDVAPFRCHVTLRNVKLRKEVLDDNVLDKFMGHLAWRCRRLELRQLTVRWSIVSSPRLQVAVDGLHIRLYGRWFDAGTMCKAIQTSRTGLFGWVDQVWEHDRDRTFGAEPGPPTAAAAAEGGGAGAGGGRG
eukprot:SAG22_NODE_6272_length_876_cov_9.411840_1_plen_232_part_01